MISHLPRRRQTRIPDPKYMTVVGHLEDLRRRLIISVLAIGAASIAGWFLAPAVIQILDAPLRTSFHSEGRLVVNTIYGAFTLQLKVAIIIGFTIGLPVTTTQLWGFLAPAFGPEANGYGPLVIGSALGLFLAGATTGFLVIPLAVAFFAGFHSADLRFLPFANEYVGFVSLILIIFGISFELPLVLVGLSAARIISSRSLASKRIAFFFGIFIFATIATPGADVVSPLILGGIMYVLFELSILVSRLIGR